MMETHAKTTSYGQIAAGFLTGLNVMGPLLRRMVESMPGNPPPSLFVQLKNPEANFYLAPGKEPLVAKVDGDEPDANFVLIADAEVFHYLVWGKLSLARAINEKAILMESRRINPPEDRPVVGAPGGPIIFNNFLYEMYLIRIGAEKLITENANLELPLPLEWKSDKEVPLEPVPEKSMLGAIANGLALVAGWVLGLVMRRAGGRRRGEDLEAPVVYSKGLESIKTPSAPSSGAKLAAMKFIFRRVDIFAVLENLARGIMAAGPFR